MDEMFLVLLFCLISCSGVVDGSSSDGIHDEDQSNAENLKHNFLNELRAIIQPKIDEVVNRKTDDLFKALKEKVQELAAAESVSSLLEQGQQILNNIDHRKLNDLSAKIPQRIRKNAEHILNRTEHDIINGFRKLRSNVKQSKRLLQTEISRTYDEMTMDIRNVSTVNDDILESGINELWLNLSYRKPKDRNTVAFSATLNRNVGTKNGETIKFDNILTNIGHGYNKTTGIFTVPVNGVYSFSCNFLVANGFSNIQILKNGNAIDRAYAAGERHETMGMLTVNVGLVKDDEIYIKRITGWSRGVFRGDLYSSFSGFLVEK